MQAGGTGSSRHIWFDKYGNFGAIYGFTLILFYGFAMPCFTDLPYSILQIYSILFY
jgi:hypothetical protein